MDSKLAKASHVAQILTFILTCWLLLRPASWSNPWDVSMRAYLLPVSLGLCLLLAAALNVAAVLIGKKTKAKEGGPSAEGTDRAAYQKAINDLTTCQSE